MNRPLSRRLLPAVVASTTLITLGAGAQSAVAADDPASQIFWRGEASSATGSSMSSSPCDVDGDERDDIVVGSWFWDKAPDSNVGGAYVLLGADDPQGGDLADPAGAGAVRIDGPRRSGAVTGFSTSCLGDIDGDGYDDIALSEYSGQRVHVVYGAASFTPVTLDSLGSRGFVVQAPDGSGNFGYSVAAAGDVDGDGLDDFMVGEVAADTQERTNNGRVWVIRGRQGLSTVEVAEDSDSVLGVIDGAASQERLGVMSRAGDVNGDDKDDIVVGSYVATPHGSASPAAGNAAVVLGGTDVGTVDLADLGERGFTITGPTRGRDRLGISVSGAGDVDGDGLDDVIVGADGVSNATTGPRSGGAAVVHGSESTGTVAVDPTAPDAVTDADGPRGYWIDGVADGDHAGYAVTGVGDVTDDGIPDQLVGAYGASPTVNGETLDGAGSAYLVPGQAGSGTVYLDSAPGVQRTDGQVAATGSAAPWPRSATSTATVATTTPPPATA